MVCNCGKKGKIIAGGSLMEPMKTTCYITFERENSIIRKHSRVYSSESDIWYWKSNNFNIWKNISGPKGWCLHSEGCYTWSSLKKIRNTMQIQLLSFLTPLCIIWGHEGRGLPVKIGFLDTLVSLNVTSIYWKVRGHRNSHGAENKVRKHFNSSLMYFFLLEMKRLDKYRSILEGVLVEWRKEVSFMAFWWNRSTHSGCGPNASHQKPEPPSPGGL